MSLALTRRRVAALAAASVGAGLLCGVLAPADAAVPSHRAAATHRAATAPAVLLASSPSPFTAVSARKAATPAKAAKPAAKPVTKAATRTRAATASMPATVATPTVATKARAVTRPARVLITDPQPPRAGALRTLRGVAPVAAVVASAAYVPTRPLPARSGSGRRIVYSERAAHLWVVGDDGTVVRDYAVTGRVGRPKPGVYHVYSKSTVAINPGEKLRFEYMVRFAVGITGARIGFHTIPRYYDGVPIQKESQLGRAIGAGGCVRQSRADAVWLYAWSRIGDAVVVRL